MRNKKSRVLINLLRRLKREESNKIKVLAAALSDLREKNEIQEFFNQYARWLGNTDKKTKEQRALENIGFLLAESGKETKQRWLASLPNVKHPVFDDALF